MAVTASWYGLALKDIACGTIDLQGDTFAAMLTTAYTPNVDTDRYRSTARATELAYTSGYTVYTITGNTVSYDAATNEIRWDFNDPTWTSASFTCAQLVVFKLNGGTTTADELILYADFGGNEQVTSGTFSYVVPGTGAGAITVI